MSESKLKDMEKAFQLKMNLMEQQNEGNNDALQKEIKALKEKLARAQPEMEDTVSSDLNYNPSNNNDNNNNATSNVDVRKTYDDDLQKQPYALKQSKLDHQKENQRLKERLARMEAEMQNNADNNLNYDSSDNESNDNSATNNVGAKKKDDYALEKERAALKQKELEQHEENQLLNERLAGMETGIQDDRHNDPYYNSSDNESDDSNDNTYNTKHSNADKKKGGNNATAYTQQRESHYHSVEIYADPNYASSDNEDPRNDIYLD
jgi:hypothetical protein